MQDRKTGGARPIGQSAGCRTDADRAVSETLQLYHAWLGYLLRRLGQDEVRVPAAELRQARRMPPAVGASRTRYTGVRGATR